MPDILLGFEVISRNRAGSTRRAASSRAWRPESSHWVGLGLTIPNLALLAVFFVWPIGRLVHDSLPGLSLDAYRAALTSEVGLRAVQRTFALAVIVTLATVVLGAFLAWEMRTGSRAKRLFIGAAVVFPLWMGVVVRNYSLTIIFEHNGVLNQALSWFPFLPAHTLEILFTPTAVGVGMITTILPYVALPLYASFLLIDLDLLRAAQSLGASGSRAFRSVALPLALPSIAASTALSFVLSLGFYVTPILLGGGTKPFVATRISDNIFVLFDFPQAAASSVILLVAATICIAVTWRAVGLKRIQGALS